jgi:hypothetical protein
MDFHKLLFDSLKDENDNVTKNYFEFQLVNFVNKIIKPNQHVLPKLYRYSSADIYNAANLVNESIHLTDAVKMNDVFEGMKFQSNVSSEIDLTDITYIKSFTEKYNDLDMWLRYADEGKGICIEYDLSKLPNNSDAFYHLYPVIYSDDRNVNVNIEKAIEEIKKIEHQRMTQTAIDDFDDLKDILPLYLFKSTHWENECEWRLIYTYLQLYADFEEIENDKFDSKELYLHDSLDVPFNCAVRIYLGPKMNSSVRDSFHKLSKFMDIQCTDMKMSNDKYEFVEDNHNEKDN